MWKQKRLQCKPGPETYLWWKLKIKHNRTHNVIFSRGLWVFTQRRGVSLETGKHDPLVPGRNLDSQRGVCILGHVLIHRVFIDYLAEAKRDAARTRWLRTQGGLEVCSIRAAKRKPSLLHTRHPQWLCLPRSQPLHLLKPAMKTMMDSNNRDCLQGHFSCLGCLAWLSVYMTLQKV